MKDKKVQISLIQTDLVWENVDKNLQNFDKLLSNISDKTEIVILPEMFSTGFTMNVANLEKPIGKKSFDWLQNKSKELNKIIVGSILIEEKNKFYNRMFWIKPDEKFVTYDKKHLFHMGNEHKVMTAGQKRSIVEYRGIKFLLQICYDLRFPVWSKNTYDKESDLYEYDAIIYIANWPKSRKQAYTNLLKARAIENQSYVIWVNRVGEDNKHIDHSGDTQLVDAEGNIINICKANQTEIIDIVLDKKQLINFRNDFKVGLDWDKFDIY